MLRHHDEQQIAINGLKSSSVKVRHFNSPNRNSIIMVWHFVDPNGISTPSLVCMVASAVHTRTLYVHALYVCTTAALNKGKIYFATHFPYFATHLFLG
jgi:hypothetical protein